MKKTFTFIVPNKKPERQCDSIKYEVKKYIARERRKKLPDGADFWDFDCKIGDDVETAEVIHVSQINKEVTKVFESGKENFYLEVMVKPKNRMPKSSVGTVEDLD